MLACVIISELSKSPQSGSRFSLALAAERATESGTKRPIGGACNHFKMSFNMVYASRILWKVILPIFLEMVYSRYDMFTYGVVAAHG